MRGEEGQKLAEEIIKLLREYGELSSADIAKMLGVNRRSVIAILTKLKKKGVVEYLGFCYGGNRCNTRWKLKIN